jgi:glycosyltransferase involved in cell wall biosynthesis
MSFSFICPLGDLESTTLDCLIDSVRSQERPDWELILLPTGLGPEPDTIRELTRGDSRIRSLAKRDANESLAEQFNHALSSVQGEFLALTSLETCLHPQALDEIGLALAAAPEADILYGDSALASSTEDGAKLFLRPEWSLERLRGHMYLGNLVFLRTSIVQSLGGLDPAFDGVHAHDLALRASEVAGRIVRIPRVLTTERNAIAAATAGCGLDPDSQGRGAIAVQRHLNRMGVRATALPGDVPGTYSVVREQVKDILVSVVIPTRGKAAVVQGQRRVLVAEAVRSLLTRAGHSNLEIIVVADSDTPQSALKDLETVGDDALRVIHYNSPFNYSEKCNIGAMASHGSALLFLNDDIEVISDGFVTQLVAPLLEPGVGMTGAKLYFDDGTIQHGGLTFYDNEYLDTYRHLDHDSLEHFLALTVSREVSGVTGAAAAILRRTYDELGGHSELLPVNFNDVDLAMKVTWSGRRILWIEAAEAFHFESQTRIPKVHPWEHRFVIKRWPTPHRDPYST